MSPELILASASVIAAFTGFLTWRLSRRRLVVEEESLTVTGSLKLVETAMAHIDYLERKMVEQRDLINKQANMIDEYLAQLKLLRGAVKTLHDFIVQQGLTPPVNSIAGLLEE